ncbi:MAG: restriction endonuclease [Gammaproteobacteria bacterium]|nr:restriction endonuclease [Gammaproteobacteria bacterium]MCP5196133.1 restriction endonuclease [Gammaproteobacteria bacterium]
MKPRIPTFDELMNPLLSALRDLGGSGSIDEIYDKVISNERFPEDVVNIIHNPEKSTLTEVAYRLAWARSYLKQFGHLENSKRGVWVLTQQAHDTPTVNPREVVGRVREEYQRNRKTEQLEDGMGEIPEAKELAQESTWVEELHRILTKEISAEQFERLAQRLLRESGFVQVEVTGRTGDGGIDGKGIARLHGFMSFHVIFQCKKYQGSVGAGEIRDFRGAMVGRADKGLFITTGTFTPAAVKEATRDGAPPIDLVDGDQLAQKLKELSLGVRTELVESVAIDSDWFKAI